MHVSDTSAAPNMHVSDTSVGKIGQTGIDVIDTFTSSNKYITNITVGESGNKSLLSDLELLDSHVFAVLDTFDRQAPAPITPNTPLLQHLAVMSHPVYDPGFTKF